MFELNVTSFKYNLLLLLIRIVLTVRFFFLIEWRSSSHRWEQLSAARLQDHCVGGGNKGGVLCLQQEPTEEDGIHSRGVFTLFMKEFSRSSRPLIDFSKTSMFSLCPKLFVFYLQLVPRYRLVSYYFCSSWGQTKTG